MRKSFPFFSTLLHSTVRYSTDFAAGMNGRTDATHCTMTSFVPITNFNMVFPRESALALTFPPFFSSHIASQWRRRRIACQRLFYGVFCSSLLRLKGNVSDVGGHSFSFFLSSFLQWEEGSKRFALSFFLCFFRFLSLSLYSRCPMGCHLGGISGDRAVTAKRLIGRVFALLEMRQFSVGIEADEKVNWMRGSIWVTFQLKHLIAAPSQCIL